MFANIKCQCVCFVPDMMVEGTLDMLELNLEFLTKLLRLQVLSKLKKNPQTHRSLTQLTSTDA